MRRRPAPLLSKENANTRAQDAAATVEAVAAEGQERNAPAVLPEQTTNQTSRAVGQLPPGVRHVRTFLDVGPSSEERWNEMRASRSAPSLSFGR